jgi:hypothetical protein
MLTGDPTATDPVCELSPDRAIVDRAVAEAALGDRLESLAPRENPPLVSAERE